MRFLIFSTLLACVLLFSEEVSTASWRSTSVVGGYNSYLDVSPVKYIVPSGLSQIEFDFWTGQSDGCAEKTINILVQPGSLPHVIETNLTFPDNFIVDQPAYKFTNKENVLSIFWPQPGPWFIIAYTESEEKTIRQKGLDADGKCIYYISSAMESGKKVHSTVIDLNEKHNVSIGNEGKLFRFNIPASTISLKIQVTECSPNPCNLTLVYLPHERSLFKTHSCSKAPCEMNIVSPPLMDLEYLEMNHDKVNESLIVAFKVSVIECTKVKSGVCFSVPKLERLQSSSPFTTVFTSVYHKVLFVDLMMASFVVVPFEILDPNDIGGTLGWNIAAVNFASENETTVEICGTLLHNYLPNFTEGFDLCSSMSNGVRQNFTHTSKGQPSLYIPYPKIGLWHVILQATCFSGDGLEVTCPKSIYLQMNLFIRPCLDNDCSGKGSCLFGSLNSDLVSFAACQCQANYRGYACTDDTYAQSVSVQLAAAYLLSMSNLFFIPAIIIAVRRRYLTEAVVYFYNMFFSTFYHACDGTRLDIYRLCITKYEVLQIGDFFGSACSLWFTLVAMACIRNRYVNPLLHIVGPLCLLVGVVYDKTSLYVIVVPIGCGLLLIATSWGHKMYKRRKLYPSWRRYLLFLLPGLVLAGTGAALFSFLETEDNYKYIHSVWHMCIALSICLFLPPHQVDDYDNKADDTSMTCNLLNPATTQSSLETNGAINSGYVHEVNEDCGSVTNNSYVREIGDVNDLGINNSYVSETISRHVSEVNNHNSSEVNNGYVSEIDNGTIQELSNSYDNDIIYSHGGEIKNGNAVKINQGYVNEINHGCAQEIKIGNASEINNG